MKASYIVKTYNFNEADFIEFVKKTYPSNFTEGTWTGMNIDDDFVSDIVKHYKEFYEAKAKERSEAVRQIKKENEEEEAKRQAEEARRQAAVSNILITSGFSFDGYTITKYSGYISGDDAVSVDRGRSSWFSRSANVEEELMKSLAIIRRNALLELKEAAYALGCNAVIGVDFDYITLEPENYDFLTERTEYLPYVFGVTANGNAVVIEKNEP